MKNSPTAPGQTDTNNDSKTSRRSKKAKAEMVDVINQVFALFRRNYHNQYFKAYGDIEELNHVKQLWLEMLARFEPQAILMGAKKVVENTDFLPTLHTMISYCEQADQQHYLPDAHSAYIEACRAPSPKNQYPWSHPAVYYAGQASDWFFLQSNTEQIAFPVFKKKYSEICEKVRSGQTIKPQEATYIEEQAPQALTKEDNRQRMSELRNNLDLL